MHFLHCIAYISSCMALLVERYMFFFIHVAQHGNSQLLGFDAFADVWDLPTIWLTEEVVVKYMCITYFRSSADAAVM